MAHLSLSCNRPAIGTLKSESCSIVASRIFHVFNFLKFSIVEFIIAFDISLDSPNVDALNNIAGGGVNVDLTTWALLDLSLLGFHQLISIAHTIGFFDGLINNPHTVIAKHSNGIGSHLWVGFFEGFDEFLIHGRIMRC